MKFYKLVEPLGEGAANVVVDGAFEPSLLDDDRGLLLRKSVPDQHQKTAEYLQRRIERNPRDLRVHTQRVLLHASKGDQRGTFCALVDLFIVLGEQGFALRSSLLQRVAERMLPEQFQFLKQRLRCGVQADEQLPDGSYSTLSHGSAENYPLVGIVGQGRNVGGDALSIAQYFLDQGNIGQAQIALEQLLIRDPGHWQACEMLLALYREHQLADAFQRFYFTLSGRSLAVPQFWRELEHYFATS